MSDERMIYHIAPADYYHSLPADQPYTPQRFAQEGFIHCTRGEDRTLLVANTVYRKTPGAFVLLTIDERKVQAEIRNEIVGEILFPHIYGPLNRDAIVRAQDMARAADGTFLPIGEPPAPLDAASAHPAALAAHASIEDVLLEARRLRKYATERITELEREIEAFRQGKPAPAPAQPAPLKPAAAAWPKVTVPKLSGERITRLEEHVAALQASLADRLDKQEARLAQLERQIASVQKQLELLAPKKSKQAATPKKATKPSR